ncbi:hypothetical protein PILCRDRAFT_816861 [Piloderma croceum F 1598]|uniref:Uncharacterized protein n=1 Tax=Piloderma croceum (strain F 1598) TaxID=765440 RepID=A0A0C3G1H1_PILCF|nr:hypothetical protein PILCRDRAFT_816861 [Piloderma croceum F 1598]
MSILRYEDYCECVAMLSAWISSLSCISQSANAQEHFEPLTSRNISRALKGNGGIIHNLIDPHDI